MINDELGHCSNGTALERIEIGQLRVWRSALGEICYDTAFLITKCSPCSYGDCEYVYISGLEPGKIWQDYVRAESIVISDA